jgi:AcrR family transcriptional regulator
MATRSRSAAPAAAAEASRPRVPRAQPLDRSELVAKALEIVRTHGADALTIRRLCDALGVTPPSVYWQVKNKDELWRLVADEVVGAVPLPGPELGDWADRCRAYIVSYRRYVFDYPGLTTIVLKAQPFPASLRASDYLLKTMLDDGFSPEDALAAYTAITAYNLGQLLYAETLLGAVPDPHVAAEDFIRRVDGFPGEHPTWDSLQEVMGKMHYGQMFRYGLEALLDGIRREQASKQRG